MRRIRVRSGRPDADAIDLAAGMIRQGGLVAFPTETVYGLGANALDPAAVERVFQAKGRPFYNPLIVHVADRDAARGLARSWPEVADRLAAAFWPGPLTLVVPRDDAVPASVTAGLPDVALRVPDHPVAMALLRAARVPIVAPSANRSGSVSPTRAAHVERSLGERVDLILDAGHTRFGIESTVVGLTGDQPLILRPGAVPESELAALIGPLGRLATGSGRHRHASPGLLDRHYAPRARVLLFDPRDRQAAAREAAVAEEAGASVAAILFKPLEVTVSRVIIMPDEPAEYARRLYAELHGLDDRGVDLILVEDVPESGAWEGVRDRLRRAATSAQSGP